MLEGCMNFLYMLMDSHGYYIAPIYFVLFFIVCTYFLNNIIIAVFFNKYLIIENENNLNTKKKYSILY
jgi:hypothetical protein